MAYHSKYLKDTGLIQAYQGFLANIMNVGAPQGDVFLEASKYFTNYEKKHKQHQQVELPQSQDTEKYEPKERKKISLQTRTRVHPSAAIITPSVFARQERSRPLIGSYKKESINYTYIDILNGKEINPDGPQETEEKKENFEENFGEKIENFDKKSENSDKKSENFEDALENAIADKQALNEGLVEEMGKSELEEKPVSEIEE